MQRLMIWRHAKAVQWSPERNDFSRALQPVGTQHAQWVAEWLLQNLAAPEQILCSPSQRTRETLAPLLSLCPPLAAVTRFIPQLYLAPGDILESCLDAAFAESGSVMIVGHNPGLERLVREVIHQRHYDEYQGLPTGTLAVIDFTLDWPEIRGRGQLSHLIRGKNLSVD